MSVTPPAVHPTRDEFDESLVERRAQRIAGPVHIETTVLLDVIGSSPLHIEYDEPDRFA
jgi:hypothetical protein